MKERIIMSSMNIRFSEPASAEKTPRQERGQSSPPPCDRESADLFMKSLEEERPGRHDLESGGTKKEETSPTPDAFASLAGMTNPLESLFSGRMEGVAPADPAAQGPDQAELEKLVERILVSTPEQGGHEVRLSLGSHALPGTEITLHRDMTGMLSVMLSSSDASSFQTLVSAQDSLKSMLEKLEGSSVRVEDTKDSGREDNDSGRRSRTYMTEDQLFPE